MRFLGTLLLVLTLNLQTSGKYDGTWSSTNGSQSGDLHITLSEDGAKWNAEASFAFEGEDIPCKVTRVEVAGTKMVLAYQFDLGGYRLLSTLTGDFASSTVSGKYDTKTVENSQPIDAGTFTATRK